MKTYEVGYSAFIAVFPRDSKGHWYGFRVEADGLWVDRPPIDLCLSRGEEAVLTRHPTGRMNEPALPFPCGVDKLKEFLAWCGYGEMDDNAHADLEKALQEYGVLSAETPVGKVEAKKDTIREILAAITGLDPEFSPEAMPGQKADFYALCQKYDRLAFKTVALPTFDGYLPGLCKFGRGARPTDYYRKIAPRIGVKCTKTA